MPKSRRNRSGTAHRRDPVSKPVKPPSDPELAALREAKILPVIRDLQSADPRSRSAAAAAVTNIIQDARCRKLLLREQIVPTVLTQTLTDSALESRAAGWGILQVLALEEEADFCVHLFRQDIVTAIEHAARTVSASLLSRDTPFLKTPKAQQKTVLSIASSLMSLLAALSEAQDDILESIASNQAITDLLFLLTSFQLESDADASHLRSDTLGCLMILSEDNPMMANKIINSGDTNCYDTLMALRKDISADGVLSCGVLHNLFTEIHGKNGAPNPNPNDSLLIPTLSQVVASVHPEQVASNGNGWSNPMEYQQLALEILASIGTTLNSSLDGDSPPKKKRKPATKENDEDMGDIEVDGHSDHGEDAGSVGGAEDDEMDEDEMEADMEDDMDMVTGVAEADDEADGFEDLPVLKSLVQSAVPELIRVASMSPNDEDTMRLQGLALSALNNIAWSVSLIDFSQEHNTGVQRAWVASGRAIWNQVIVGILSMDTADVNLATTVTSLAWAVARTLRGRRFLVSEEQRKFMALYQATKGSDATQGHEDPFQGLGVKCMGVLGQLAIDPAPTDLNREIGTFLITVLAGLPDTPTADAVEALNQLFDIYGNEDYAYDKDVFWKDNFVKHLEDLLPKARAMVKAIDKRAHAELRTRADEAVLNLNRFLAYKRKNKP